MTLLRLVLSPFLLLLSFGGWPTGGRNAEKVGMMRERGLEVPGRGFISIYESHLRIKLQKQPNYEKSVIYRRENTENLSAGVFVVVCPGRCLEAGAKLCELS